MQGAIQVLCFTFLLLPFYTSLNRLELIKDFLHRLRVSPMTHVIALAEYRRQNVMQTMFRATYFM